MSNSMRLQYSCLLNNRVKEEIAKATADAVWNKMKSGNIRDCVKIGMMAKSIEDVTFIVEAFMKCLF
jgi:hypothetical protein